MKKRKILEESRDLYEYQKEKAFAGNPFYSQANRDLVDFVVLANKFDDFRRFVRLHKDGNGSIDYTDPLALREYTRISLLLGFNLIVRIPPANLIPRVPNRLDYLCWIHELLRKHLNVNEANERIRGLDIGTGACAIYPLLGHRCFGFDFVGTDINSDSVEAAEENVKANKIASENISIRLNPDASAIFTGKNLLHPDDRFHFCMCNPPFFADADEKLANNLNCVIQPHEEVTTGGEISFVTRMISESLLSVPRNKILLYTSLLGKESSYHHIKALLEQHQVFVASVAFQLANTARWAVCWKI